MSYTKDVDKMTIFFNDSNVTLHGKLVFNDRDEPEQFIISDDIVFSVSESKMISMNNYSCKIKIDEQNLNKIQKRYPQLFKTIKEYTVYKFCLFVVDNITTQYVENDYPELVDDDFDEFVDEEFNTFDTLLQQYNNVDLETMLQCIPLDVMIVYDEK
jgi:hypothetical protein